MKRAGGRAQPEQPAPRPGVPLLRLFRVRALPGCTAGLAHELATTSAGLVRDQPGMLGFLAGGPVAVAARDFVFATMWRDGAALEAFFGADWRAPLLPPGYAQLIESCTVEHYELTAQYSAGAAQGAAKRAAAVADVAPGSRTRRTSNGSTRRSPARL